MCHGGAPGPQERCLGTLLTYLGACWHPSVWLGRGAWATPWALAAALFGLRQSTYCLCFTGVSVSGVLGTRSLR